MSPTIFNDETAKSVKSLGLKDNATNQIRMKIYSVHIQTAWVENCFGQRKLLKRTANNAKLGTSKKLKQNCAKREPKMNCPNCTAKLRYMKNTLEHAENKTIET